MTGSDERARLAAAYARRSDKGLYSAFEPAHLRMLQEVERTVLNLLARNGCTSLEETRLLDVGCGNGYWLRRMLDWGAQPENLCGIDALHDRTAAAARLLPAACCVRTGNAMELPWPDNSFDCVSQFVVFSSILDPQRRSRLAEEMLRVLRPDGLVLWYDFHRDNPANKDVEGISRREFSRLFPTGRPERRTVTLAPPLARRVARYAPWTLGLLARIPLLRTHHVTVMRK